MEIKYKLYPYPVLSSYSDDYKNGSFDVTIDPVRDGYNIRLDFLATLTCQSLLECLKRGDAKYVYHLECAQTGFRTVVQTDEISTSYTLYRQTVNGKLQICPFIVAVKDLKGYSSADFHDDYQRETFDIEAGCVMAVGKMATVDITKNIDDLANTPSIFSITPNPDTNCSQMLVDMSQRKIMIKLPWKDYANYRALRSLPEAQSVLNSLTIIPALVYVFGQLRVQSIEERNLNNSDTLWYRVLSKTLSTQFNCDIESAQFDSQNFLELAQKLVNDPLADAFKFLTTSSNPFGGDGE